MGEVRGWRPTLSCHRKSNTQKKKINKNNPVRNKKRKKEATQKS
jgi:hypothetical protein